MTTTTADPRPSTTFPSFPVETVLGQALDGATIYAVHCARCHEEDSTEEQGPELQGLRLPIDDFALVVFNGSGSMPGFYDTLTPVEVQAVAEFVSDGL